MCGGGGGGDGGAAEREAERERKIADTVSQINTIFGIVPEGGQAANTSAVDYTGDNNIDISEAQKNRTARDAEYTTTKDDIMSYFTSRLDDQQTDVRRGLKHDLARSGLTGGSAELDAKEKIRERSDDAVLNFTNEADAAATSLRSNDEDARLNLIAQVQAGMNNESAVAGALQSLRNNASEAKQTALSQPVGDLFSDIAGIYKKRQYDEGYQQGRYPQPQKGAVINNSRSYGGTVKR